MYTHILNLHYYIRIRTRSKFHIKLGVYMSEKQENAPDKENQARRIQEANEFDPNSYCGEELRGISEAIGIERQRGSGAVCKNANQTRAQNIGGMMRQLSEIRQAHLAYVDAHAERLKKRLAENQEHRKTFTETASKLENEINKLLAEVQAVEEEVELHEK